MASNYPHILPKDQSGETMQNYPAATVAVGRTTAIPPAASSVITLGDTTTTIEIAALNGAVAMRWLPSSIISGLGNTSVIAIAGATSNYDHIIPINTTRRFVVPIQKVPDHNSVMGANGANGLFNSLAVISVSSTLSAISEY
jgi:hypothetical protein